MLQFPESARRIRPMHHVASHRRTISGPSAVPAVSMTPRFWFGYALID